MDAPPPYSLTPETPAIRLPPVTRWHPKMSLYRVFVIVSTVVLGTLKAAFAYRGVSMIATTLEWIAGVVFTLLLFALDELESKEIYPKRLRWLFTFDCTELMWRTLHHVFSVSRPRYRSDELKERLGNLPCVPVTGYRILVSATVIALGSVKAALAFLGYNTTANSFDWTLAVFITSLFYYIGLYESNSLNLAPNFFVRDLYTIFFRIGRGTLVALVLSVNLWGTIVGASITLSNLQNYLHDFMTPDPSEKDFILIQSLSIFMICVWAYITTLLLLGAVATLIMIVLAVQEEPEFFSFVFRRRKFAKFYDNLTDWTLNMAAVLLHLLLPAQRVAYFIVRIIIHLFGIVALSSMLVAFICLMKLFGEQFDLQGGLTRKLLGFLAIQLFFVYGISVMLWGLYHLIRSLILPFLLPASPVTLDA